MSSDLAASPADSDRAQGQNAEISIVIPAYRARETITRALDSALSQCGGRVRVIVVIDDGCEETRQLIECRQDQRVIVVTNARNLGAPASRNRGLSLVTTPLVMFLDADDFVEGDLAEQLAAKMRSQGADIGFGPSLLWTADGFTRHFIPNYRSHDDVFLRWFGQDEYVNTASVLWSANYLRSIGAWDDSLLRNQDGELALRAILLGARFVQSSVGAGVWSSHEGEFRITKRTDTLGSLIDVVRKLQRISAQNVTESARQQATASHLHDIAKRAYRIGEDEVGDEAMLMRRQLGYADASGSFTCRIAVALRALPRGPRTAVWRFAASTRKYLKRRPAVSTIGDRPASQYAGPDPLQDTKRRHGSN